MLQLPSCSVVSHSSPPWTVSLQAPLSMEFSRSGVTCPPPGHLPDPGTAPVSSESPALAGRFFTLVPSGKPN